jgi:two-component system OmpR family sensor kinase
LETRQLELSIVNLDEMLREVFEFAQSKTENNPRQLSLQIPQAPWPLPNITADHDLLFLALLNLLDNAIKYSQPDDTIELRASENGNTVVIEVADTGPGIPDDEIDEVWRELFRGKGARGIPGSGLGLALVQAIITRHNGQTKIRSRSNQGTVVSVHLPTGDVTKP